MISKYSDCPADMSIAELDTGRYSGKDLYDRYWCSKCGTYTIVDKGDEPYYCSYCGVEFWDWKKQ